MTRDMVFCANGLFLEVILEIRNGDPGREKQGSEEIQARAHLGLRTAVGVL